VDFATTLMTTIASELKMWNFEINDSWNASRLFKRALARVCISRRPWNSWP
jgi:hypothetical protein